jgi:hypothetical protein|tara:strand:- start:1743 stop:2417 length:675 start_codon:yes stop_codon:yes gene_type:complete
MAINFMAVQELTRQYNDDPRSFSDQEAEMIANLSQQFGLDFQRTSRPGAKGAFDAADMAAFGMLPNQWRPESRGDTVLGESGIDEVGGGVGTVAGLFGAGAVAKKGYQGAKAGFNKIFGSSTHADDIIRKSAQGVQRSPRGLLPAPEGGAGGLVPAPRQLGQGFPQLSQGQRQLGQGQYQLGQGFSQIGQGQRQIGQGNLLQLTGLQGYSPTDAGLMYDQLRPY